MLMKMMLKMEKRFTLDYQETEHLNFNHVFPSLISIVFDVCSIVNDHLTNNYATTKLGGSSIA
jgi:hypothetical protein